MVAVAEPQVQDHGGLIPIAGETAAPNLQNQEPRPIPLKDAHITFTIVGPGDVAGIATSVAVSGNGVNTADDHAGVTYTEAEMRATTLKRMPVDLIGIRSGLALPERVIPVQNSATRAVR